MLILAGTNPALLEGLSQALAGAGTGIAVAGSLAEAEELRTRQQPVLVVAERALVEAAPGHAFLGAIVAAAVPLVTWREAGAGQLPLPRALARLVLADLELPLERNRLAALAAHAVSRARDVGRAAPPVTRPERPAS